MAALDGLAPTTFRFKVGCCSCLMVNIGKWWLRPASHRTLLVFSETLIYLSYTAMPKPLVYLSSRAGNRDNKGPAASHGIMTRLMVDSRAATVIAVDHSQSVSFGDDSGLSSGSAPSSVAVDGGVFTPGGLLFGNHVEGLVG